MKLFTTIAIAIAALMFASCASTSFQSVEKLLGSPAMVQTDISIIGGLAKSHLSAETQVRIHQFAVTLQSASDLNLDALYALLPSTTGSLAGDSIISAAKSYLASAVKTYGSRNPTSLAYARAVAQGLLVQF